MLAIPPQNTMPTAALWALFLGLCGAAAAFRFLQHRKKLPLPPQPPGWPVVGNTIEFLRAAGRGEMHLLLQRWAEEHGEVVRVQVGPLTSYYLNSAEAVKALFDKSSAQTSERPRWIVSNEQLTNGWNVLLLPASHPRWKIQRKIIHTDMTSLAMADAGVPFLHYETARFLHEVAHDPKAGTAAQDLWTQVGRYTYSNFAMQAFGFSIDSAADDDIRFIHESGKRQIEGTLPGRHFVDVVPLLDRLPLRLKPWERAARRSFREDMAWCRARMAQVMQRGGSGGGVSEKEKKEKEEEKEEPSRRTVEDFTMLKRILADESLRGLSGTDEAAFLALQLIIGAADTSRMSTWSFLEAMMMYPAVQRRAQALVDAAVGATPPGDGEGGGRRPGRVPEWADLDAVPYVRCLMKETWRWRPPVALGHPHTTTREAEYAGMRIPAGSRLHLNAWAIHRCSSSSSPSSSSSSSSAAGPRWAHPDEFDPGRYEGDALTSQQSAALADVARRDHFAFGAGRRICPGLHVAERSLGVAVMRILWAFDVGVKPGAAAGTTRPLDPAAYRGFMPGNPGEKLPVVLTPRSEERVRVLDAYWEEQKVKSF